MRLRLAFALLALGLLGFAACVYLMDATHTTATAARSAASWAELSNDGTREWVVASIPMRRGHAYDVSVCGDLAGDPHLRAVFRAGRDVVHRLPLTPDDARARRCVEGRWVATRDAPVRIALAAGQVPPPRVATRFELHGARRIDVFALLPVAFILAGLALFVFSTPAREISVPRGDASADPAVAPAPALVDRPFAILWAIAAYVATSVFVSIVVAALIVLSGSGSMALERASTVASSLLVQHGAMIAVAYFFLRRKGSTDLHASVGLVRTNVVGVVRAIGLGLVVVVVAFTAVRFIRDVSQSPLGRMMQQPPLRYTIAVGALLAPLSEELFFRGVIIGALRRFGAVLAVVVSVLIFTAAHATQLSGAWAGLIPIATIATVNAVLRVRTGGLTEPWIVHTVYNLTLASGLFFA